MITKEKFIEIMAEDGINQNGANHLWGRAKKTMEEHPKVSNDFHIKAIHETNKELGFLVPARFRIKKEV